MMSAIGQIEISELPIWEINIKFDPSTPSSIISEFKKALSTSTGMSDISYKVVGQGDTETTTKISHVLNIVFNTITILIMFMCFFALSANMSANLYQ